MSPRSYPVDEIVPELIAALRGGSAAILRAPTGAGKTTRVPPAILDAGFGDVIVLQPRRLAARAAARRIAAERGVEVGGEVGYHVRFDRRVGARTRLTVATEGIVVRRLQEDPFLEGVGCLVFDEFHERRLDADLALAMARRVQREVRSDLKLVVMSATLDGERIAEFLGGCPILVSEGKVFPVDVERLPARGREPLERHVARGVDVALARTTGDVLVFLPGLGEIRRAGAALASVVRRGGLDVVELYGDLPPERQDAVLAAGDRRRLVLATNVAETSVTIAGIAAVVDSGLARTRRYHPSVGLDRLELGRISLASAEQRKGRAGRTAPGLCIRLWSAMEERTFQPSVEPEIARVDLTGAVLELLAWGETDVAAFPWFEPPPALALERALELLTRLGAVAGGAVTELGRDLARLPVHPRLARLVVEGVRLGVPERAALAAALLAERDPVVRGERGRPSRHASDSDVLDRVFALEDFERTGGTHAGPLQLNSGAARFLLRARDQYLRVARDVGGGRGGGELELAADEALLRALLAAFPDRVARRREPGSARAVMVGGRGVRLAETSAVTEPELFLCVDLDAGRGEARVRQASAIEREWLDPAGFEQRLLIGFDGERLRVSGTKATLWNGLVLEEAAHAVTDDAEAARILAAAAALDLPRALPLDKPEVAGFLARVRSLRHWMPELDLPAFDDEALIALLPALAHGRRSFAELAKAPLLGALRGALTAKQTQALEREAPERLPVPSGSHIRLAYEPGRPPVLAARIQELFGLRTTPRVAAGRIPVLLHLLAPNGRPQQVTDDLESFWNGTYGVVRKELRRRYPKHAWPEDPWAARPERRPGRRR